MPEYESRLLTTSLRLNASARGIFFYEKLRYILLGKATALALSSLREKLPRSALFPRQLGGLTCSRKLGGLRLLMLESPGR